MHQVAQRHGVSARQVVLAWLLARSPMILAIPGTGSVPHVEANVSAAALRLDADEVATLTGPGNG